MGLSMGFYEGQDDAVVAAVMSGAATPAATSGAAKNFVNESLTPIIKPVSGKNSADAVVNSVGSKIRGNSASEGSNDHKLKSAAPKAIPKLGNGGGAFKNLRGILAPLPPTSKPSKVPSSVSSFRKQLQGAPAPLDLLSLSVNPVLKSQSPPVRGQKKSHPLLAPFDCCLLEYRKRRSNVKMYSDPTLHCFMLLTLIQLVRNYLALIWLSHMPNLSTCVCIS
jgi:hypothetical protein